MVIFFAGYSICDFSEYFLFFHQVGVQNVKIYIFENKTSSEKDKLAQNHQILLI